MLLTLQHAMTSGITVGAFMLEITTVTLTHPRPECKTITLVGRIFPPTRETLVLALFLVAMFTGSTLVALGI